MSLQANVVTIVLLWVGMTGYSVAQPNPFRADQGTSIGELLAQPKYSEWGSVVRLEGGWAANVMTLFHSAPVVNPGFCGTVDAGYATDPADSGSNLYHTLLLSAFLNRKEVQVLIQGCAFNKPRIVAVGVR